MSEDTARWNQLITQAKTFLERVTSSAWDAAAAQFDATMSQAMPAAKLEETWQTIEAQAGKFEKQTGVRTTVDQGYECVFVGTSFANAPLEMKVVFDKDSKITGLLFTPPQ